MRVMAVDPGSRRIGVALSDALGIVARGLEILEHESIASDSERLVLLASRFAVDRIVVGLATDSEGQSGPQAKRALRLIAAIRARSNTPVEPWDESFSTEAARMARLQAGQRRKARRSHVDASAAAAILQDYLDAQRSE